MDNRHRIRGVLLLDLDGTLWDTPDISSHTPPFQAHGDLLWDARGRQVRLNAGARELLEKARQTGWITAALSWNTPHTAQEALSALGLIGWFDYLLIEPHPHKGRMLSKLLNLLSHDPRLCGSPPRRLRFVYVDDRRIHLEEMAWLGVSIRFVQYGVDVKSLQELVMVLGEQGGGTLWEE